MLLNLKSAIAARGMRQVDLAMQLKITPSVLSEIVNGRREPDASLRSRIAEALDVDEQWLFSRVTRIPRASSSSSEAALAAVSCAAGRQA